MSTEIATRGGTSALSIHDGQTSWTPQQLSTLEQLGVAGAGEGDLAVFFHQSVRTGLDPFAKQLYMIGRKDRANVDGQWVDVTKWTIQTGIDGYRLVARRAADRAGQQLTYDDTLWCGPDGEWRDVWLQPQPPLAAKVVVYRGAERFSAVAHWPEYVQTKRTADGDVPNSMWSRMGRNQLAKCAEALALRKAFPQDLSGIYTDDEMGQADSRAEQQAEETRQREEQRAAQSQQAQRVSSTRAQRPAAQAPRVVDGETAGDTVEARPARAPRVERTEEQWVQAVADCHSLDACHKLFHEATAAGWADRDIDGVDLGDRIKARAEQLQQPAQTAAQRAAQPAAAEPVPGSTVTAEAAPAAQPAPVADPPDLCRDTAVRRGVMSALVELLASDAETPELAAAMVADAAAEEYGVDVEQVSTKRLREWLTRRTRGIAAA